MARTNKLVLTTPTTAAAEIPTMAPAPRLPGCRHVSFGPEITPAIPNASCQIELRCSYEAATSGNSGYSNSRLDPRNLPTKPSWHSQAIGSVEPVSPLVSEFAGQSVQSSGPLFDFPAQGKLFMAHRQRLVTCVNEWPVQKSRHVSEQPGHPRWHRFSQVSSAQASHTSSGAAIVPV